MKKYSFAIILTLIYLSSLLILLSAHSVRVHKDPGLTGEELAIAYRDVYLLPTRAQDNCYATTFSSAIYYWAGSYLLPISVNSQRIFKIIGMAFLPVLIVLIMRTIRPQTTWRSAAAAALVFLVMPAVTWFSIMVQDFPSDCVFSFLALYLALRFSWQDRPVKVAGYLLAIGLLIVWFIHFYGGSFPLAVIIPLLLGWKALTGPSPERIERLAGWLVFCLATFALVWWPKLYFGPAVVMFNGGRTLTLNWPAVGHSFSVLFEDIFVASNSYLLGGWMIYPALPGLWYQIVFIALLLAGIFLLWRERNSYLFWLLLIAFFSFIMGGLFGDVPGIRRVFPFLIVAAIWLGFGLEAAGRFGRGKLLQFALILVLVGSAAFTFYGTYRHISLTYQSWLQRDFTYLPGKNYEQTVEALIARSQHEQVILRPHEYSYDLYLLLKLFCQRRGLADKNLVWAAQ